MSKYNILKFFRIPKDNLENVNTVDISNFNNSKNENKKDVEIIPYDEENIIIDTYKMMRNNSFFTIYSDSDKVYYYKTFEATYFEPTNLKSRNLYEMKFEGKIFFMLSIQQIDKFFLSDIFLNDKTYEYIYIMGNQYLAKYILKGYENRAKRRLFKGLVIKADFEKTYKISEFLNQYDLENNHPFFFILDKEYKEIYDVLSTNPNLICRLDFDNYNTFFPKIYLFLLNYILMISLFGFSIYWVFLLCIYKSQTNEIQKWFTGILIIKCLYIFLIIRSINLNYIRADNSKEELFIEFKMIFFDTILSALNVIYKTIFLFIFLLIFEVN